MKDFEIEMDNGLHFRAQMVRRDRASDYGRAGSKPREKKVPCIRLLGYSQQSLRVSTPYPEYVSRNAGLGVAVHRILPPLLLEYIEWCCLAALVTTRTARVGVNDSPAELNVV